MKNLHSIAIVLCTIMFFLFLQSCTSTQPAKTAARQGEKFSKAMKSGERKNNQMTLLDTAEVTPIDSVAVGTKTNQKTIPQECVSTDACKKQNSSVCKGSMAQCSACPVKKETSDETSKKSTKENENKK